MKKHMKKCLPDVVLYIDRFDTHARGFNDLPLLKSITSTFGASIWSKVIIVLTHASSTPAEGVSFEASIDQRSHIVQELIWNAHGDIKLKNPVILVENHPSYRRNMEAQRTKLLLSCYSSKILSEAKSLHKVQGSSVHKFFNFFLSSLHESKPHTKLTSDIYGVDNSDAYSDEFLEQEDQYSKQKQKKQSKKQIKRLEEIKKGEENSQDLAFPPPFDSDDTVDLHRSLEPSSGHHTGFLWDTRVYDHYYGFDGVSLKIPGAIYVKLKKDKKDWRMNLESSVLTRHKKNGSLLANFDTQIIDNQMAYGGNVEVKLSKMAVRVGMNNQRRGRIRVRTSSWEPLEMVIMGLVLIDMYIFRRQWPGECSSS
ncbi:uncharacterized protein A4U43_C02F21130 [Asparagus officinalis]|uniref:Translocase of chloroplast 159/132 membrane anchor domain-containing protein n=2 Tax=Asparagus officinalis TaxID=4686 RepID=A0A5P1FPP1_ASPOF|nr:uncharacterized protein A4U43_C02F21130 [Asparagus officinalis]